MELDSGTKQLLLAYCAQELLLDEPVAPRPALQERPSAERAVERGSRASAGAMDELRKRHEDCARCRLSGGRSRIVFGIGAPSSGVLVVAPPPGEAEDRDGNVFAGDSGELLEKMLSAIGLSPANAWITPLVKCRPPDRREPGSDTLTACRKILDEEIAAAAPRAVLAIGEAAAKALQGPGSNAFTVPCVATFDPARLIEEPSLKPKAWDDLKRFRKIVRK